MKNDSISDAEIGLILLRYGVSVTCELCEAIRLYVSVLLFWNKKISLTSITDVREIIKFHFGESMFAKSAAHIKKGRLADVGSGAGFPGVPLRMISPDLEVTLIESNAKKAAFLSEIVRQLDINIEVFKGRSKDFPGSAPAFKFVTSRAVGHLENLVAWSQKHLSEGGTAVFWATAGQDLHQLNILTSWNWLLPIKIPESNERILLSGSYVGRDR